MERLYRASWSHRMEVTLLHNQTRQYQYAVSYKSSSFLFSSAAWQKHRTRPKTLTESDVREKPPSDHTLACPMCSKLFREAVNTPCCSTTYCEDCIQTHLLERDFTCPGCNSKIGSLVKLVPNKEVRALTRSYIDKAIEESKAAAEEAAGDMKPGDPVCGFFLPYRSSSSLPSADWR